METQEEGTPSSRNFPQILDLLKGRRLVLVSNREPYIHKRSKRGINSERGPGGLVAGLDPIMRLTGGLWVAWGSGNADFALASGDAPLGVPPDDPRYELKRVRLSSTEVRNYYYGFANRTLWPLFHHMLGRVTFEQRYWNAYRRVNERFARAVLEELRLDDIILVNDYHLCLVPSLLREEGGVGRIGFFNHIPWPPWEVFRALPWHREVLLGMLGADVIGFHIESYVKNFLRCVESELDLPVEMKEGTVELPAHQVKVAAFPLGIDYGELAVLAREGEIIKRAAGIKRRMKAEHLILGVERLDYTKGIPERLLAFEHLLARYPSYRGRVSLIQKVSPSRSKVREYQQLKREIDGLVGHINGRFQRLDWVPVHYLYQNLPFPQLISLYLAADVGLVTPLVDGLNLVAKEYVAVKGQSRDGVLILSEAAGAAQQLSEALIVNPYDIPGMAQAIRTALAMPPAEKRRRMEALEGEVKEHNIYWWLGELLGEVAGPDG